MTITLLVVGKTNIDFVNTGVDEYLKRLKKYVKFEIITINDLKNSKKISELEIKKAEGDLILSYSIKYDHIVLLDNNGNEYFSEQFANWIEKRINLGTRKLLFVVGGAYGFSADVYNVANEKISLSKMTFSHQMIRLIFTEQLYRAFTIIKGEPYHHK